MARSMKVKQSEEPMAGIAQRIRKARDARGWSQEETAVRAEVSRPTIARIERGDDVSTATLVKVISALGLTVEVAEAGQAAATRRAAEP
ncbi:helix-turn-helix domain-containing protein [Streptomyces sp. NBC_01760]|uniref:helix-turn-helix domain-containing protein n=1 Tax=Streptomyces sp. NBC_01760 TaxID=2975931 RepID=UPI003FA3CA87